MLRRLALLLLLLLPAPALAQVEGPTHVFTNETVADADEVNENFADIYNGALSRTVASMLGHLKFGTDNTWDIGASGANRPRDLFLARDFTLGGTLLCTGCVNSAQLASTAVAANTYGTSGSAFPIFTVDGDGRITSASSWPVSLLGGILEAGIVDGTIFPRLNANETVLAAWTFNGNNTVSNVTPISFFHQTDGATNEKYWAWVTEGSTFGLYAYNDTLTAAAIPLNFIRSGTTVGTATLAATTVNLVGTTAQLQANTAVTGTFSASQGATFSAGIAVASDATIGGNATVTGSLSVGTFSPSIMRVGDGSVGAPTHSFTSDTDTGMYRASTPSLNFGVSGVAILTLAESGGVSFITTNLNTRGLYPNATLTYDQGASGNRYNVGYFNAVDTLSDVRYKRNVVPLAAGLSFVRALRPVEYDDLMGNKAHRYGFLAQDLQTAGYPGVSVGDDPAKTMGVNYQDLIAPLTKAVQELAAKLEAAEARIKGLEARP